jgi:hypothetical protein
MEKAYEKHFWKLILALELLCVAGGLLAVFLPEVHAEADVELVTDVSRSKLEAARTQ